MPGPVPLLSMSVKSESLDDIGGHEKKSVTGSEVGGLDAQLWHACAGGMVQLPHVGAKVVYFPQGHGEQAASTPEFPRTLVPNGSVPCRVVSVNFLADTETDEVFARICLQPEIGSSAQDLTDDSLASPPLEKPASFAKTLTQSDANNGGGFSIPRYCAETIFPPLDYCIDPPVQTVLAKDVHGEVWKFRHIYRGTPRRHLLTTGWSTFVNQKKLVAGDAIVFLRIASGELCVGVRRSMRGVSNGESSSWHSSISNASTIRPSRWEVKGTESFSDFLGGVGDNGYALNSSIRSENQGSPTTSSFARDRARVTAKSVLEAAALAVSGERFEVVYYPRASTAEFCVKAGLVKRALEQSWYAGMRFKMAFETEDSSRISWFMGTIAAVQAADPVLWPSSPWRVLQVTWDEPDLLQGVNRVSPWQLELVATLPMQLPPVSLPKKKLRTVQPQELPLQPPGLLSLPLAGTSNFGGHLATPWGSSVLLDDASVGMQGARHDQFNGLPTVDFRNSNYKRPREFSRDNQYQIQDHQVFHPRPVLNEPPATNTGNYFSLLPSLQRRPDISPSIQPLAFMSASGSSQLETSSTKTAATSFFLFGQFIDPSCTSKPQQRSTVINNASVAGDGKHPGTNNSSSDNKSEDKDNCRDVQPILNGIAVRSGFRADIAAKKFQQSDSAHPTEASRGSQVSSLPWWQTQDAHKDQEFHGDSQTPHTPASGSQ
ncbi:auxin response factor 18 [Physcomitrium patens]|uniref:Auxin response factor n=1 Tax=Physcomitrium patens TaxID=3218 RepID=A0A2K1KHA0_PHYPA|nr:auxin response factor 16-like [Physcomitrium patens]XP_024377980.1 auxin response factor 16-like [Physcomitrium patens]XP_024377981.1 auxin response factor 16-like [Physcomitrium patens]XP_024377982.1 auxin response factor 16-like [Physcomitrium patens]XP_024377983.1 auxin response factor 16-like [Physcomitrium patens]XP_024377985.1 auxin response factor 16-like [Physcomitrium patens]XP_024377986.1 auxin response factor 16-like [Physcomitrium patens]XP_024377987.1 auxin response factor 16|eukprot:XP_024377979.1 auxin response factor 16-like [Physcomitrella patens]